MILRSSSICFSPEPLKPEPPKMCIRDSVYAAKWFSPLREALTAFVDKTQEYVTGTTNFRLYKGNIIKEGTTSPYSLYDEDIASFKTGDLYDHHDAEGFITLYGLSTKAVSYTHLLW